MGNCSVYCAYGIERNCAYGTEEKEEVRLLREINSRQRLDIACETLPNLMDW